MEKKFFGKFNIIDMIIFGVILLSLFALVFRMVSGSDEDKGVYAVTFICEEAPEVLLWEIEKGELCTDGDSGTELGEVSDIFIVPADENSKPIAYITSQTEAYKADHGIAVDDTVYLKGSRINLIIGDSIFEVYIKDIK